MLIFLLLRPIFFFLFRLKAPMTAAAILLNFIGATNFILSNLVNEKTREAWVEALTKNSKVLHSTNCNLKKYARASDLPSWLRQCPMHARSALSKKKKKEEVNFRNFIQQYRLFLYNSLSNSELHKTDSTRNFPWIIKMEACNCFPAQY